MNKILLAFICVFAFQHRSVAQRKMEQIDTLVHKTDTAVKAQHYEIPPRSIVSPEGTNEGILLLTRIGDEFAKVEHFEPSMPGQYQKTTLYLKKGEPIFIRKKTRWIALATQTPKDSMRRPVYNTNEYYVYSYRKGDYCYKKSYADSGKVPLERFYVDRILSWLKGPMLTRYLKTPLRERPEKLDMGRFASLPRDTSIAAGRHVDSGYFPGEAPLLEHYRAGDKKISVKTGTGDITVKETFDGSPYTFEKTYFKTSKNLIFSVLFYRNISVGTATRYKDDGTITAEYDLEGDFPFAMDQLAALLCERYNVDLGNVHEVPGLERNAFQKRYAVSFAERDKQFRRLSISGADGKILSDETVKIP